jgi:hypothetical protein
MSADALAPVRRAGFEVHSIHFDFPGGQAIRLRDPASDDFLGASPEWIANPPREEPVAYVRAIRPHIRVVFRGSSAGNSTHVISADGVPFGVDEQAVALSFDPVSGLSQAVDFRLRVPLPDQIGLHPARLDWYVRDPAEASVVLAAGTSQHRICTSWRPMVPNPPQGLDSWTYQPLMEWTCQWAAGQDDEKDICDAIVRGLGSAGLRYGVLAGNLREMLLLRGAMCGVWYQAFQQMAHCQGIFLHRRCFLVDWRALPNGEEQWCALVIRAGGLNQPHPIHPASRFHDNDTVFPLAAPCVLSTRTEPRYRFWGRPGFLRDGHCVNFLEHKGRLYLYDACFGAGPFEIDSPLPPDDFSRWGGMQLASFKGRYLDGAVDYMLGTLYNGTVLLRSVWASGTNGMTVRTALIPDQVGAHPGLTFYWGP